MLLLRVALGIGVALVVQQGIRQRGDRSLLPRFAVFSFVWLTESSGRSAPESQSFVHTGDKSLRTRERELYGEKGSRFRVRVEGIAPPAKSSRAKAVVLLPFECWCVRPVVSCRTYVDGIRYQFTLCAAVAAAAGFRVCAFAPACAACCTQVVWHALGV